MSLARRYFLRRRSRRGVKKGVEPMPRYIDVDQTISDIKEYKMFNYYEIEQSDIIDFLDGNEDVIEGIVSEWISIKDRLPERKGQYIVAYHPCMWDNVMQETVVGIDSYRGGKGGIWVKNKYQRVTHWMPMPLPPKEDK